MRENVGIVLISFGFGWLSCCAFAVWLIKRDKW